MKNLIYILIFLPSLLFSQETKNMELVGVRNIHVNKSINSSEEILNFEIQEGIIYKIISLSHSNTGYDSPNKIFLDGDCILYNERDSYILSDYQVKLPLFIEAGLHQMEVQGSWNLECQGTLYGLEFKLTTP